MFADGAEVIAMPYDVSAVAVRGNPEHPFTCAGLCVKANNYERRCVVEESSREEANVEIIMFAAVH
jgi:hypothetical protein